MPGTEEVARVGVRVLPELERFREELRRGLNRSVKGLKVQVPVDFDPDKMRVRLQRSMARATGGVRAEIPVWFVPEAPVLNAKLRALIAAAVRGVEAEVPVKFNTKNMPKLGNGRGGGGGGSPGALLRDIAKYATLAGVALGTLANSLPVLASVWAGLVQLASAAWLLPGALVAAGAAFATVRVATAGFADALKGDEEALRNLSPAARQTVQALRGLEGQWTRLRSAVQERFFANMAQDVRVLAEAYLPTLEDGMGRVATAINSTLRDAMATLSQADQVTAVDEIFGHTAKAITNARSALGDFLAGLLSVGVVASDFLPDMANAVASIAKEFRDWAYDNPDQIRNMIQNGIDALNDLWVTVQNVGAIIDIVFTNLGAGGAQSFLQVLRDLTTEALQFLSTVEAQDNLQAFGEALGVAGQAVRDIFLAALQALLPIMGALAPVLSEIARQAAAVLVPAFQLLGETFAAMAPWLRENASAIATIVLILGGFGGVVGVAAKVLGAFGVQITTVGATIKTIVGIVKLFTTVFRALNLVLIANPIGLVVTVIGLLIAAFITAYNTSETFRNIVQGAFNAVVSAGKACVDGIIAAFNWFTTLPSLAAGWMSSFLSSIVSGGQQVIAWFGRLPSTILSALGNVGSFLYNSGVALIQGFWNGLKAVWNRVVSWVQSAMAWLRGFWPFSPAKRGAFSGTGYLTYSGRAMMEDWGKAIQEGGRRVGAIANSLMGDLQSTFSEPLASNFAPDIERVANALPSGMQAEVNGVVSSDDFGLVSEQLAAAVVDGLTGSTLRVDGNGVAKLVNKSNIRRVRRG